MRQVLLLGSVPLSDSKQVFETVAKIFNGSVKRIPDGETGPRSFWMRWQGAVFSDNPQFELAKTTSTTHAQGYTYQHYRVRAMSIRRRCGSDRWATHDMRRRHT